LAKGESGLLTAYAYNAANAMTVISPAGLAPVTQSYDACGNLTGQNAGGVLSTYTWDPQNRLLVAATSASVDTFTYDAFGHRVTKLSSLGLGPQNRSYYTPVPSGYGGLSGHRQYEAELSRFYASDLQGHTRQVTDAAGTHVATYAYSAFGEPVLASADATPLRYGGDVGYYRDDDSRLYVRARHYDPANARWLSRDPAGASGGLNLYGYAGNDPIGMMDATGMAPHARQMTSQQRAAWAALFRERQAEIQADNSPMGHLHALGSEIAAGASSFFTAQHWRDTGHVFEGYGDALNPVKAAQGLGTLAGYADSHGYVAAGKMALHGAWHGLIEWTTTGDPREFGSSFLTFELVVAPGLKRIPTPAFLKISGSGLFAPAALAAALTKHPAIMKAGDRLVIFVAERRITGALKRVKRIEGTRQAGEAARFYGTRLHSQLERQVNVFGKPHIRPEVSYRLRNLANRYQRGSVRYDIIVQRGSRIVAVYDLKTGVQGLTQSRIAQMRLHLPANSVNAVIKELRIK
jgi:RHS repeat-associated protein